MRARYYAPGQGRFVTQDEWPQDVTDPQGHNDFGYARDNPVLLNDPSGHQPQALVVPIVCAVTAPACAAAIGTAAVGTVLVVGTWVVVNVSVDYLRQHPELVTPLFRVSSYPGGRPVPIPAPTAPPVLNPPKPWEQWQPVPKATNPNELPLAESGPRPMGRTRSLYPRARQATNNRYTTQLGATIRLLITERDMTCCTLVY